VNRKINVPTHHGFVQFLGEQTLAANVSEGSILDGVASSGKNLDLNVAGLSQLWVSGYQSVADLVRLSERKGASTGTDYQLGSGGHGSGVVRAGRAHEKDNLPNGAHRQYFRPPTERNE
jgi:hypothetical protein